MALSVVDLYRSVLPKTNCRDCGYPTCLAFASMVVSERYPLRHCPHIAADVLARCEEELAAQYAEGKWLKRDLAADALAWARRRAASLELADLPARVGGTLVEQDGQLQLRLPYFTKFLRIAANTVMLEDGSTLGRLEQVFILNHLAQGGRAFPTGIWRGFIELPNTTSKVKSMQAHVEAPLIARFSGRTADLLARAQLLGGRAMPDQGSADIALLLTPLPRIPVALLFWDNLASEDFPASCKLLFDQTITDHLDIESILFLSERIRQMLLDE